MDFTLLHEKLSASRIGSDILLGSVKLFDASSREFPSFNDPLYFPFYYHLGSVVKAKHVSQVGGKLGLIGACFLQARPSVETWTIESWTIEEPVTTPSMVRLISSNLKRFSPNCEVSVLPGDQFSDHLIDLGIVAGALPATDLRKCLDRLWDRLEPEGLLVVDYIANDAIKDVFNEFCGVKNRIPETFATRYGVGIITR